MHLIKIHVKCIINTICVTVSFNKIGCYLSIVIWFQVNRLFKQVLNKLLNLLDVREFSLQLKIVYQNMCHGIMNIAVSPKHGVFHFRSPYKSNLLCKKTLLAMIDPTSLQVAVTSNSRWQFREEMPRWIWRNNARLMRIPLRDSKQWSLSVC